MQLQVRLAEVLAGVLGVQAGPVGRHFLQDLGADSLLMAQFCARVRKQPDLPTVSMKEIYGNPNISALAAALQVPPQPDHQEEPPRQPWRPCRDAGADGRHGPGSTSTCGALQTLVYLGYCLARRPPRGRVVPMGVPGRRAWQPPMVGVRYELPGRSTCGRGLHGGGVRGPVHPAHCGEVDHRRALPSPGDPHLEPRLLPLLAGQDLDANLARSVLMTGTPLTTFYLRAMGAKVGRNVTILTNRLPVCTDLLTIGEGTVIRKDVLANGYRAHGGVIQLGAVTLGRDVIISDGSVLDINTSMGDDSQLGHRSTVVHRPSRACGRTVARVTRAGAQTWTTAGSNGPPTVRGAGDGSPRPSSWPRLGLGRILVGQAVILFVLATRTWRRCWRRRRLAFTSWVFYGDASSTPA